ncbi:MAG: site-2 protease family protein, partial [Planctomycetota bacterium]|nr:site-2 protease family protein [Planctomycetota bacterium]
MTSENDDNIEGSKELPDEDLEFLPQEVRLAHQVQTSLFRHPDTVTADRDMYARQLADYQRYKRRQFRTSVILFVLTLASTFLVGSYYVPIRWFATKVSPAYEQQLERQILESALKSGDAPESLDAFLWDNVISGLMYAVPLMSILFCHEMGHYLQSVRHRVPASFPYFIPLPLPPLGTMGAVILQGRGVAT